MTIRTSLAIVFLAAILSWGCDTAPATGSATMTVNGMKITADGQNPSVSSDGKAITVSVGGKKATVEQDEILIDGVKQANIPPGAKTVRLLSRNNQLVIEIDGKEVSPAAQ